MHACVRVIASELISHDKLILREAPAAAPSERHLGFHGSTLSSLCAEPDNGVGAGGKKKKKISPHRRKVSGNFMAALSLSNVSHLQGRNLPYVRLKSGREEPVLWAVWAQQWSSVRDVDDYAVRPTLFKCWRGDTKTTNVEKAALFICFYTWYLSSSAAKDGFKILRSESVWASISCVSMTLELST